MAGEARWLTPENFTPEERDAVAQLLRHTIKADPYPLSPRLKPLKSALAKLDPSPGRPSAEPYPPAKAWVNSSIGRKSRGPR